MDCKGNECDVIIASNTATIAANSSQIIGELGAIHALLEQPGSSGNGSAQWLTSANGYFCWGILFAVVLIWGIRTRL